jgi:hypothetical protein
MTTPEWITKHCGDYERHEMHHPYEDKQLVCLGMTSALAHLVQLDPSADPQSHVDGGA